MNKPDDELLTVAEASARLGVSVRTVRRLLSMAEYGGRTQAVERHTSKGVRVTTMLPPDLLADLHAKMLLTNGEQARADREGNPEAHTGALSGASGSTPPNDATEKVDDGNLPAPAYRALIQAQAQTIEVMRAEVTYLRDALTLSQQNLAREQALRSLPAPTAAEMPVTETQAQEMPQAPPAAPGGAQTGAGVQDQAQAAERTEEAGTLGPGNWWARLWRRE